MLLRNPDPLVSQLQGLVFVALSWRDLLARLSHPPVRAQSWCGRCPRPQEQPRSRSSRRLKHTDSEKSPHLPRFPKGDMQGQRRYRTPPTRRGRAPSLLARENKFVRGTYFPHSPRDQPRAECKGVCRGPGMEESGEYNIRSDSTSVLEWLLARNSFYVLTVIHTDTHPAPMLEYLPSQKGSRWLSFSPL